MPGFINIHTHIPMALLRGYSDDLELKGWLDNILPLEAKFDARAVKTGALLGMAEAIAAGITSISDMYFYIPKIAEAAYEAGIKINLCNESTCISPDSYDPECNQSMCEMGEMLENWHNLDNGRIKLDVGIHAEYTSFESVWQRNAEFAKKHGLNVHMHLSETQNEHENCVKRYGLTPAQLFDRAGVFENHTIAAHCVWVTDEDIELLSQRGVTVAHNPVSNLKLASGIARIPYMMESGLNIGIGTDSVCSNNSLDMFEEIKTAVITQKNAANDSSAISAYEGLKLAIINGAKAQGRENECGRIRKGFDADLIMLDFSKPHLNPCHDVISNLVYSARGGDVCMTIVRGKILYENGDFKTLDLQKIYSELYQYALPRFIGN
jgi:5-methylthioadenosine/S-adenosylhomocysteine deaminase